MTRLTNDSSDLGVRSDKTPRPEAVIMEKQGDEMAHASNTSGSENGTGRQANKGILADRVAQELNVPRRTASRVLDAVLDSIRDLLKARGRVAVKGFGTFERRIRKGRAYKHPLTGNSIEVADKETIMFKPSDQLIADTRTGVVPPRKGG